MARSGRLEGVRTSLGWLVDPKDVQRLAGERMEKAEKKLSAMKSARSRGAAGIRARRPGRGRGLKASGQ